MNVLDVVFKTSFANILFRLRHRHDKYYMLIKKDEGDMWQSDMCLFLKKEYAIKHLNDINEQKPSTSYDIVEVLHYGYGGE